jgi:glutamate synthase (NADPH/NADH) small chain
VTGGAGDSPIGWAYDGRRSATMIDRFLQEASLTAGRLMEGPQPTRLFVSTAGHQPLAAVHPAVPTEGYSAEEARDEAARCLRCECLECVKVCTYLEHFGGYPRKYAREIYNNSSIVAGERKSNLLINSCMLCGLCTTVCPEDFSMPDLCLSARREMIGRGRMPPSAHEFALEDYTWSQSDAFALCRHEPGTTASAYAFYPGCQLAGSNPGQVEQVYKHLRGCLTGGVGLILDCCGAPAQWAGRQDLFESGIVRLATRWESLGRPKLIFACPTCHLLVTPGLPGVEAFFLSEVLESVGPPEVTAAGAPHPVRALHDPCTSRHNRAMQESVRRFLDTLDQPVEELAFSGETTECCGYGGLQANANPDLARRVAGRRGNESPAEFVTYCAMCRDSLASTGKRAIHLLDLLFPGGPDPAARSRPGWSERRENRARLREGLLAALWGEGGELVEDHEAVELVVSPEIQERLDDRRILAEDVRKVIEHAERTGDRLCHQDSGRYLASFRPRAATFWVEYSPEGEGFRVHNAYAHRMTAELGVG